LAFDSLLYRKVLGQFATGITIVTTRLPGGEPWAMTANSFTSISLDPPIVMVAVSHGLTSNDAIRRSGAFAVNILRSAQIELSRRYSRRERPPDQFADVTLSRAVTGAPIIEGCLGWVDCRLTDQTEQGDHTVFFGTVQALDLAEQLGDPLLYYNSSYMRIRPAPDGDEPGGDSEAAELVLADADSGSY
jgi:3-hydroxy-9,10-secoandrosta-1,3,5(10)-triene-9,17-dione monooxygenase reductase component